MALVVYDRVQQTGTANTTVSFTLSGSVTGYQSFAVVGDGNTTYYGAIDASGNWEVGLGTYSTSGPTLTRTTILSSSSSNTAVSTFSGSVNIFVTYPAEKSINYDANGVATIGSILGYSDTGIIGSFASTVAGYNQVILQNKSSDTTASANFNVSNDQGTAGANYAEFGINSSTFSNGAGAFNIPGASYLASASTDLSIGTYGAYNIHFATHSGNTDAMTIFNDGGASLGGLGDPGIGNIAINNAVVGFTSITAAAGTTVLTSSSTQVQAVTGTTTQTIQLPQATTLLKGTFYTISNTSSDLVTVKDNAGTILETIPSGGAAQFLCANNATSAGTWGVRVFAASNTTWGNTALNYTGNITSATWQGNTIASGYGGTGLTTFSSSNYALYSTSPSTLVAGTLPVLAGGTGTTTSTGSGSTVLSSSPNLTTPNLGVATATSISLASSAGTSSNTSNLNLGGTLGFSDTGILANFVSTTNSYNQVVVQNLSSGASASSEFIAYSNAGSASTNFATVGINSTGYTGTGSINAAGYGYFLTGSTDLVIGTIGSNNLHMTTNSQATDAITITPNNAVAFNGSYGSSGYYLQSNGASAAPAWVAFSGGATITPTTTNTAYYLVGTSATAGSLTAASISVTSPVSYNASSGTLSAPVHYASQGFHTNAQTNTASYTVPSSTNAMTAGPYTVATGTTITVSTGSRWVVV